jgi:hypothetical protein
MTRNKIQFLRHYSHDPWQSPEMVVARDASLREIKGPRHEECAASHMKHWILTYMNKCKKNYGSWPSLKKSCKWIIMNLWLTELAKYK